MYKSLLNKDKVMGITKELDQKLEDAFENLKANIQNPLVISHLQSDDKEFNIYLIAKDPSTELYYGILETKFIDKRQIAGIPRSNILGIDIKEKPMIPFRAKSYLETGIIERGNSLSCLFIEDREFQEKIMQIHYFKSEDYIYLNKDDLLYSLGFSKGMDSVLM